MNTLAPARCTNGDYKHSTLKIRPAWIIIPININGTEKRQTELIY